MKKKISLDDLKIESFWINPTPEAQMGGSSEWGECTAGSFSYDCHCGGGGGGSGPGGPGPGTGYGGCYTTTPDSGCHNWGTDYQCATYNCPTTYGCTQVTDYAPAGGCNTQADPNGVICTTPGEYPGC